MSDSRFNVFYTDSKQELLDLNDDPESVGIILIDGIEMWVDLIDGKLQVFDINRTGESLGTINDSGTFQFKPARPETYFEDGRFQGEVRREREPSGFEIHKKAGGRILDRTERKRIQKKSREERGEFRDAYKEEEEENQRKAVKDKLEEEGQEELEQELISQRRIAPNATRGIRRRQRVSGSWRDQGKGDCFTTKRGQVVCEGSIGMNYTKKDRKNRGDPDQKGRSKKKAIALNRAVLKKYDDEGRIENIEDAIYYIPIKKEGEQVLLIPQDSVNRVEGIDIDFNQTVYEPQFDRAEKKILARQPEVIKVPIEEFNAQYRTSRGLQKGGGRFDTLIETEYELLDNDKEEDQVKGRKIRQTSEQVKEANKDIEQTRRAERKLIAQSKAARPAGGIRGLKKAVRRIRETRRSARLLS